jgi:hypothetical protein
MENRLPSPLQVYHDRLTTAQCNRASRHNDNLVTCNLPHCDLLAILLNRLHGEGSFDQTLLMRLRAFVELKEERTKRLTECRSCLEVHDVMHKRGDAARGSSAVPDAARSHSFGVGIGLGMGMAMSGKRGLDDTLSPHAMVAHASYTRAAEVRHGVVTPLADYQSLQEALQQKRQELETVAAARAQGNQQQQQQHQHASQVTPFARAPQRTDENAAGSSGSDSTDLAYALRILDKMIDDVAAAADACATLRDYTCERCAASKKRQRTR